MLIQHYYLILFEFQICHFLWMPFEGKKRFPHLGSHVEFSYQLLSLFNSLE